MEDNYEVITNNHGIHYYKNKKRHRDNDLPAVEYNTGTRMWFINGKLHREGGPAIIYPGGVKEWWINGKKHREGDPAVEYPSGAEEWYINGLRHREDGPAVTWSSDGTKEWWINNIDITEEVKEWITSNNIPDYKKWTNKEKSLFKLKFL